MMNLLSNLLRGTIDILLIIVVVKVLFNYLVLGTPFSKRRMMYKFAKMRVDKRGGFKKDEKTKDYYEYKVWKSEQRSELIKNMLSYSLTGIKLTSRFCMKKLNKHRKSTQAIRPTEFSNNLDKYFVKFVE